MLVGVREEMVFDGNVFSSFSFDNDRALPKNNTPQSSDQCVTHGDKTIPKNCPRPEKRLRSW